MACIALSINDCSRCSTIHGVWSEAVDDQPNQGAEDDESNHNAHNLPDSESWLDIVVFVGREAVLVVVERVSGHVGVFIIING